MHCTVKFLNFQMLENCAVIYLKFKQSGKTKEFLVQNVQIEWQTVKTLIRLLLEERSDLGLHSLPQEEQFDEGPHSLPRPNCPKTWNHYRYHF